MALTPKIIKSIAPMVLIAIAFYISSAAIHSHAQKTHKCFRNHDDRGVVCFKAEG